MRIKKVLVCLLIAFTIGGCANSRPPGVVANPHSEYSRGWIDGEEYAKETIDGEEAPEWMAAGFFLGGLGVSLAWTTDTELDTYPEEDSALYLLGYRDAYRCKVQVRNTNDAWQGLACWVLVAIIYYVSAE